MVFFITDGLQDLMKSYNPKSKAEKYKKVLNDLRKLVHYTLRPRVVDWMRKDPNSKTIFENDIKLNEKEYKDDSFEKYLIKMV
jgi:hypothetical protein